MFPFSDLLRRDERKSKPFPFSTCSFVCLFQILMDYKTIRICPLLVKNKQPPTIPSSTPRHSCGQPDVAGVDMSKMELGEMIHHKRGGRSRRLERSALAGGGPRSSATLLFLLQGARARPVVALPKVGGENAGDKNAQTTRRFQ